LLALKTIYEDDVFVNEGEDLPKNYADWQPVRIPKIAHGNLCVCLKRLTDFMHWDAWEMKEAFKRIKNGEIVGEWPKIPLTGA